MSTHVYPYILSFKSHRKDRGRIQRVVLVHSTKTRTKDHVMKVKGCWGEDWSTVVNITQEFKDFFAKDVIETKAFTVRFGDMVKNDWTSERDLIGGLLGYDHSTFYWNIMRWVLVKALSGYYVTTMEEEINSLSDARLKELNGIPNPTLIIGKTREPLIGYEDRPDFHWHNEGLEYKYDYIEELERICSPIGLRVQANF